MPFNPEFTNKTFKNPDTVLYMQMIAIICTMGLFTSVTAQNMASSLNSDIMFAASGKYRDSYNAIIFYFIAGIALYIFLPGLWATGFLLVGMYAVYINLATIWAPAMQDASYLHGPSEYYVTKEQKQDADVAMWFGDVASRLTIPTLIVFYAYNKKDVWMPYIESFIA